MSSRPVWATVPSLRPAWDNSETLSQKNPEKQKLKIKKTSFVFGNLLGISLAYYFSILAPNYIQY
jgi:hypothetical protein